jgi:hypothetical protein
VAAGAARAVEPGPVAIAWTAQEERLDPQELDYGEYLACDVQIDEEAGDGVQLWRLRERVTTDARDLGYVRDAAGNLLGRVVSMDGSLIEWRGSEA